MNGVSVRHSPRYILTGKHAFYDKHCKVQPGEYAHVHESHDNGMPPRTVGAIAIGSTFNDDGVVAYFSLKTGRRLERAHVTPLPMPDDVIDRVEHMVRRMPGITFGDRNNAPVIYDDDDDDDSDYDDNEHTADDTDDDDDDNTDNDDNDNNDDDNDDDNDNDIADGTIDDAIADDGDIPNGATVGANGETEPNANVGAPPENVGAPPKNVSVPPARASYP